MAYHKQQASKFQSDEKARSWHLVVQSDTDHRIRTHTTFRPKSARITANSPRIPLINQEQRQQLCSCFPLLLCFSNTKSTVNSNLNSSNSYYQNSDSLVDLGRGTCEQGSLVQQASKQQAQRNQNQTTGGWQIQLANQQNANQICRLQRENCNKKKVSRKLPLNLFMDQAVLGSISESESVPHEHEVPPCQ